MDSELVEDLEEALQGVDPVEFLLADPLLHGVAEDLWNLSDSQDSNGEIPDLLATAEVAGGDSQQQLNNDGLDSVGGTSCSGSASPCSSYSGSDSSKTDMKISNPAAKKQYSKNNQGASCVVCHRPARGYRYYGAVVCNSCRAFFSRAIKDETYKEYLCINEGTDSVCQMSSKSCQKCRFNRCLKVGMDPPDGIALDYLEENGLNGEDENVNPEQEKVTVIEWGDRGIGKNLMNRTTRLLQPAATLTEEEKHAMRELTARQVRQGYVSMSNLIRSNIDIFTASMDYYYKGKHYPLNLNKTAEDYMSYSAARNYFDSQEYPLCRLKSKDISRLIEGNFPLVAEYVHAYSMNKKTGLGEEVKMYVRTVLDDINGDAEFRQKITSIYTEVIHGTFL